MEIRKLLSNEKEGAMRLCLEVFYECIPSDYTKEGIVSFEHFISSKSLYREVNVYGAIINHKLIGVIATKCNSSHISLFFVRKQYRGQKIGRKLFEYIKNICKSSYITVNSFTCSVEVYYKLGFKKVDIIQHVKGTKYIPMKYIFPKK